MTAGEDLVGWPPAVAARYRERGYWAGHTLGGILRARAAAHPARTALVDGAHRLSYSTVDGLADRVAAGLRARGIGGGDRVLVHLPNVAEFVTTLFGCFRAGAVPVLALPAHRETELVHLAELSGAVAYVAADVHGGVDYRPVAHAVAAHVRHVFTVHRDGDEAPVTPFDLLLAEEPEPGRDDAAPGDVALLLLSGGTTGLPKLIARTHDDYHYNVRESAAVAGLDADAVYLAALPAAHNFALGCPGVLGALWAGGTAVLAPGGDPETAFALIARERVTHVALVPPLVLIWLDAAAYGAGGTDLGSLRVLQAGGSRLAAQAAHRVGPVLRCRLQQVYGMAEGLLNLTRLDDPDSLVMDTQGRPLSPDDEVVIVDLAGRPLPDGSAGELWVRGPYTPRGYYRAAAHNRTAFTPDGFYRSGDLVRRLPSGHLRVEGRLKDVVNRGGDKVPVEEVENLLLAHPRVHDAAVVGYPDPMLGERTCAFVVARGTAPTRRDLVAHLNARGVAAFKLPDRVRVVDAFPRTGVGKVDRTALARLLDAAQPKE